MKPTVLIATSSLWFPAARLAMALHKAGFTVEALCPPHHPLSRISAVRRTYTYSGLFPVASVANALKIAQPVLVVPGDDLTTRHLQLIHMRELNRGSEGARICSLIERSLGSAESFPVVYERAKFMRLAQEQGIRVPKTMVIKDLSSLRHWATEVGFPAVLKADGTSGGMGVRTVSTLEESAEAYRKLNAPPSFARAAKRAVVNRDQTLIWPSLLRQRSAVSAQTMIVGREATSTVACWEGTVLAAMHFEVLHKRYAKGPATVIRSIQHAEMISAVEKMVQRLKLSGIHGFDFMIESNSGEAYLIEINPRTTQVGHLALGSGQDLPAALLAAVTGAQIEPSPIVTEMDTVALFPQEWMRDPSSPFIQSSYHDVPWEEPALLEACMEHALRQSTWSVRNSTEAIRQSNPANFQLVKAKLKESRHE